MLPEAIERDSLGRVGDKDLPYEVQALCRQPQVGWEAVFHAHDPLRQAHI